jgi:hypothetical protein
MDLFGAVFDFSPVSLAHVSVARGRQSRSWPVLRLGCWHGWPYFRRCCRRVGITEGGRSIGPARSSLRYPRFLSIIGKHPSQPDTLTDGRPPAQKVRVPGDAEGKGHLRATEGAFTRSLATPKIPRTYFSAPTFSVFIPIHARFSSKTSAQSLSSGPGVSL